MKKSFAWFLAFAPAAVTYACGGGDNTNIDGGMDSTTTDGPGADTSKQDSGGMDSSQMDSGNMDAGKDGTTVSITCTEPAECVDGGNLDAAYPPDSSGVVCCATVSTSGTFPSCSVDSLTTQCSSAAACPTSVMLSCTTDTLRACAHNSECQENKGTGQDYTHCCYVQLDAGRAQACMSSFMISALKATCLDGG